MMPPPDLLDLENNVSQLLSNLTDIQRDGGQFGDTYVEDDKLL